MPDDVPTAWNRVRLLDLVSIRNGQVDPRNERYRNLPLIAPDHIAPRSGRLLAKSSAADQGAISGKYIVEPGDVVYSKIRPYLQKAHLCKFRALCSADMYPLTPKPGVSGSFILHTMLGKKFTDFATSVSARSGIPKINRAEIAEFNLVVPSPSEQEAIGQVLDDADRLIAALERLIAKKRAVKQGLMQQLLMGQNRLPGHSGEWSTGPLKDFLPLQRGFDLPTSRVVNGPYPVVYSNGIARHHAKAMAKGPGVVTGRSGTIGKVHFVEGDYWPHNTSLWVTSFARVDAKFAFYFLAYLGLERFASGSGVPTFNRNDAHSFEITVPTDRAEQKAIADVLSAVDCELEGLRRQLDQASSIKAGMMQQLLTGRKRLTGDGGAAE
ncbi:restriction endonuclease subunit S [Streptomyces sp. CB01373]|uniref:restriction endonuclease subunit S n=1 Tax=Streptomyces sp. CB01373 TaxID=2020325 RepID=UPI000C28036B|nr:restriction endonuclease subunit S [Streptomyces sp. CB01373]PJM92121.1 hypothetical protein CG719_30315 [Streptomyces sp. CB01373]